MRPRTVHLLIAGSVTSLAVALAIAQPPSKPAPAPPVPQAPPAATPSPIGFNGGMLVRFQTTDRAKAVKWYREVLGFEILFEVDEIGWSELVNREAKLTIGLMQNPADKGGANATEGVVPVLGVNDIDAARKHLESKSVKFTGETETIPNLVKLATFLDPDGHRIMMFQSLGE